MLTPNSGCSRSHPSGFHQTMAEVFDGLSIYYDDGTRGYWYHELRASQHLGASDTDWRGVSSEMIAALNSPRAGLVIGG